MAKKIQIIIILLALISCQSNQEKLIGHWHEFKTNDSEYLNCYQITDSTIGVNPMSNGGFSELRRGLDIEQSEILSLANESDNWTSDFTIRGNKLILNDSIFWIRQNDKEESFLTDFSAGLLLNIVPFESNNSEYDLIPNDKTTGGYIFIGKPKSRILNKYKKFNKDQYYIQINDKIVEKNDILRFMDFGHSEITIFMHVDRNTPKELLTEIESEMSKINISKRQIYYLTINSKELISGYNHSY